MTKQEFATLAYTKSPKTSKRTTFQDELQVAVSARASRAIMDQYSEDFNDDEDDFLNELLNSRKKKVDAFKAGRSKAKTVNFEFSDDEDKPTKTKRVSFLKTQRIHSPLEGTSIDGQIENEYSSYSIDGCSSFSSKHSTNVSDQSSDKRSDLGSTHSRDTQESTNRSLSHQLSEDTLQDIPLPLPSDSSIGENSYPVTADRNGTPQPHTTPLKQTAEKELPIPKPRQRIQGVTKHAIEKSASQDLSVLPTSSASVPLSTLTPDQETAFSCSPNHADGDHAALSSISHSFSNAFNSEDSKDQGLSFEELTISHPSSATLDNSRDQLDISTTQLNSHIPDNSHDTLTSHCHIKGPQKPRCVCSKKVESKYLGTLKVLDRNISAISESQPQAADLRAAVYQEWLKKKKEKSRQNMDMKKKKEEIVTEKKKEEQETKKEGAVASYEAWKEKKLESLKVKAKEKQEKLRKEQRAFEEKEEKRKIAEQVFENWKREHNHLLKEKYRKVRKNEIEQKFQQQEKEEGRKSISKSAFSEWCEKKKNDLLEEAAAKHKELKDNAETERYMKEERDKMALDMYESWLARKDLEKKRHKEERWLQAILQDSPPPPWSPPNKTIPYGK